MRLKNSKIYLSIFIISFATLSCNKNSSNRIEKPDTIYTGIVYGFDNTCGTFGNKTAIIKMENNVINETLISELTPDSLLYTSTLETKYQIIGKRISFGVKGLPEVNPERSITICTTDKVRAFKDVYSVTDLN